MCGREISRAETLAPIRAWLNIDSGQMKRLADWIFDALFAVAIPEYPMPQMLYFDGEGGSGKTVASSVISPLIPYSLDALHFLAREDRNGINKALAAARQRPVIAHADFGPVARMISRNRRKTLYLEMVTTILMRPAASFTYPGGDRNTAIAAARRLVWARFGQEMSRLPAETSKNSAEATP